MHELHDKRVHFYVCVKEQRGMLHNIIEYKDTAANDRNDELSGIHNMNRGVSSGGIS